MSTAGKVLTVLIMLVMIVWVVLLSGVTQLNVNHGLKIQAQEKDLAKVTEDAAAAATAYLDTTEKARQEQDQTDRDVRIKLTDISTAERRKSTTLESLARITLQLEGVTRDAVTARTNLDNREAEKVKDEELLAKLRDEIAKLQALNAEYKTQLAQLQNDFKRILAENAAMVKQPVVKPASTIRPTPAS